MIGEHLERLFCKAAWRSLHIYRNVIIGIPSLSLQLGRKANILSQTNLAEFALLRAGGTDWEEGDIRLAKLLGIAFESLYLNSSFTTFLFTFLCS